MFHPNSWDEGADDKNCHKSNAERHVPRIFHRLGLRLSKEDTSRSHPEIASDFTQEQLAAVGARIAPVGPVLLERYFVSLRLPEIVSDARVPATAK
jgi:hypothetical protein